MKSKFKMRFTKRAGSSATGSNGSCAEIAGYSRDYDPCGVHVGILMLVKCLGVLEGRAWWNPTLNLHV